jgi:hypothetical protein
MCALQVTICELLCVFVSAAKEYKFLVRPIIIIIIIIINRY